MNLELESTEIIANINGTPARLWRGRTGKGVHVVAYVAAIQVDAGAAVDELERELCEVSPPAGVCRMCGCTDHSACKMPASANGACRWVDASHTLCSRCAP